MPIKLLQPIREKFKKNKEKMEELTLKLV